MCIQEKMKIRGNNIIILMGNRITENCVVTFALLFKDELSHIPLPCTGKSFIVCCWYFLKKCRLYQTTTVTNQNFIISCQHFSYFYLSVSLWHFSRMFVLSIGWWFNIFLFFAVCWALGLVVQKHKGSVSLLSLMGDYQKFYLYISAISCGWMAANLNQRVY